MKLCYFEDKTERITIVINILLKSIKNSLILPVKKYILQFSSCYSLEEFLFILSIYPFFAHYITILYTFFVFFIIKYSDIVFHIKLCQIHELQKQQKKYQYKLANMIET